MLLQFCDICLESIPYCECPQDQDAGITSLIDKIERELDIPFEEMTKAEVNIKRHIKEFKEAK
jgi:hypothetical protein